MTPEDGDDEIRCGSMLPVAGDEAADRKPVDLQPTDPRPLRGSNSGAGGRWRRCPQQDE
jgi:hypothetical protein